MKSRRWLAAVACLSLSVAVGRPLAASHGPGTITSNDCRDVLKRKERRSRTKAMTHAWNYGQCSQGASLATGLPIDAEVR
ncbi:hypothetical protein [Peterkaempfera bronchialis]|uniref:hypothetical protein n=1 Tax=Peterkaempfera bronchialis TaxID=2126346 RepID=UPI0013B4456E|nr:hypothetical protein [Peterkaempfera bronchialis]